jgi:thiol peroxidase
MSTSRSTLIKFRGKERTTLGAEIQAGQPAPDFGAVTRQWTEARPLREATGKVIVLASVPSLDTDVCDRETRRFNLEAAGLSQDVQIYVISVDLPYAQERWCGAAGVDRVVTLSDHAQVDFGMKYGCLMDEVRVLRRAVFVVDRTGRISYVDYMPANGEEPDYPEVLAAVARAL